MSAIHRFAIYRVLRRVAGPVLAWRVAFFRGSWS